MEENKTNIFPLILTKKTDRNGRKQTKTELMRHKKTETDKRYGNKQKQAETDRKIRKQKNGQKQTETNKTKRSEQNLTFKKTETNRKG